jgi:hypothetical protein
MIIDVFHFSNSFIDFCISVSVLLSNAEVASSKIKISGFFRKIRAMLILCFSHQLSFNHLSQIIEFNHFSVLNTNDAFAFSRASSISFIVAFGLANLKFSKIVVLNRVLSCITIHICFLKELFLISFMFIPSISISHFSISNNLRSNFVTVDFHQPVSHTRAIFSQGFIVKFIFFNTSFSFVYAKLTSLNSIFQVTFFSSFEFLSSISCSILSKVVYNFLAHSSCFCRFLK